MGRTEHPDSSGRTITTTPFGWFAYVQGQLSYAVYAGLRYDHVEEPFHHGATTRNISANLSYYTTEFLRLRAGIEHKLSDLAPINGVTTALLEFNVVFGSHPTEPYWVNR